MAFAPAEALRHPGIPPVLNRVLERTRKFGHSVVQLLEPDPNSFEALARKSQQERPTPHTISEAPPQGHPKEGIIDTLHRIADDPTTTTGKVAEYLLTHKGVGKVDEIARTVGTEPPEVERLGKVKGVFEIRRGKNEEEILASPPLERELQKASSNK